LHQHDAEHLLYDIAKPRPDRPRALVLTPLELIDKIAALVPPPRIHRHRYYGVLAPNAPLRAAVTALARGPPLWEAAAGAPPAGNAPHWELAAQPLPEIEFDQRLAW
jgi:hypothetical protein